MSEMIERKLGDPLSESAQRGQFALIQKFGRTGAWDAFILGEMARVVIAAIREPTEAMLRAAIAEPITEHVDGMITLALVHGATPLDEFESTPLVMWWRAMIDEALATNGNARDRG